MEQTGISFGGQKKFGLTDVEVVQSRKLSGTNVLTPPVKTPWWKDYISKFDDPVIRILMVAAVIAMVGGAAHGGYIEGVGILIAIFLATAIAFVNEYKANQEFEILNKTEEGTPVRTMRNSNLVTIPKCELVVGDVIQLEAGEEVPADAEVISQVSILVDQASLTGEKDPVAKFAVGCVPPESAGDQTLSADQVYRGTTVVDGHGVCGITAVGDRTKIGGVAQSSAEETSEVTPLNEQLAGLSKVIGVVGFLIAALAFAALVVSGYLHSEFKLTNAQFLFGLAVLVSTMVGLSKVWLPWVFDGFELVKAEVSPPAFLEAEGWAPWLATIGAGALILAASTAALIVSGNGWADVILPSDAASSILTAFMIAVTIIVVAVPEGLAMSVTLSLAYSMRRMTRANTLVRRSHACETIGSATVICSDKTGTLTTSRMELLQLVSPMLDGGLRQGDSTSHLVAEAVAVNSTADLTVTANGLEALGNPTESAMLLWLEKSGPEFQYMKLRDAFQIESQLTFSTERKFMATFGCSNTLGGSKVLFVKGAPEIVLSRCSSIGLGKGTAPLTDAVRGGIESQLATYQMRGMRTLGIAWREGALHSADLDSESNNLVWIGFAVIDDPIRPEVPAAIKACIAAGIEVKIITGDNTPTAREIGRQIGLSIDGPGSVLTGAEFGAMSDEQALMAVKCLRVLSRAQPQHKQRVVQLLQRHGEVVAVTGDGVNDGPALNYADVGMAMGKTGTSVARAASDMVILDDSFGSIVSGVMWGRSLYRNIQRFIVFQLTINVAALVIALLGPFIGVAIPLNVIQMLWVNLIMDTFAALALATEPADASVMEDRPRGRSEFIITPSMMRSIFGWGFSFVVVLLTMLLWMKSNAEGGQVTAHDLTVFYCVFVMLQFWNIFNARRFGSVKSAFSEFAENKLFVIIAVVIFVGQIVIVQFGGAVFKTVPLSLADWLIVIGCTSPVLLCGEAVRAVKRGRAGVLLNR